jgi:hypothetical protein
LIAADDMKRMNVEQLDDAFRLSLVDASTMVWKAGMKTWQSLGAVAGIDDEPEDSITRHMSAPPPPPRPMARPVPRPPSRAPTSFHTAVTPVFAAPLMAPVFTPQLYAPDPYALPKRRVAIPSEVDFRRSSGGVRWGRWLVALLLLTGGVLGAYRQNLLREGARRLGVESKYLASEQRAVAFVSAKAPTSVKNVLTRLSLLPGPNAVSAAAPAPRSTPAPVVAAPIVEATRPSSVANSEPEVKTVSLDSLPVLATEPVAKVAAVAPGVPAPVARAKAEPPPPRVASKLAVRKEAETEDEATPVKQTKRAPKAEAAEPIAKAEPKAKPEPKPKAEPPPPANESFLKAAIRSAIAADAKKK